MESYKRRVSDRHFSGPLSTRVRHARKLAQSTQAEFAKRLHVGPSAVAQWELPTGTSPTVEHLIEIAITSSVAFEWLSTGRGPVTLRGEEMPAIDPSSFTNDPFEDRLLIAFRRVPARKRVALLRWMEEFF